MNTEVWASTKPLMVIGGQLVGAVRGDTYTVTNPASGLAVAVVPRGSEDDIARAIAAAEAVLPAWSRSPASTRGHLLYRLATLIADHTDELAQLDSASIGRPIRNTRVDVVNAAATIEYYAGAATKILGETIPVTTPGLDLTLREPIGVVGLLVPWNFPMALAAWKIGPALAAGNTCVLKPASYSPLSALRIGELALEAGIPAGVLNVVTGPGAELGPALLRDKRVGKVSFTGETDTGKELMRLASENLTRLTLELGGKSPNIIFADADVDLAASVSPLAVFGNAGQNCCARTRLFVDSSIHDRVLDTFTAATKRLVVGDPSHEQTDIGPLVSPRQRDRVAGYVRVGQAEGAMVALGGVPPSDPTLESGCYFLPTILDQVEPQMRVAQDEIFGPVVTVISFRSEEEVIKAANETRYGLAASVWTNDISRALRVARAIKAGDISININRHAHLEAPFGGFKESGVGRELGMHALDHYTEIKNIFISIPDA